MLCPKCGAVMEETDAFCSNCGSMSMTVENSTREEPTRHPPEQIYPEKPMEKTPEPVAPKASKRLLIFTIILAIITALSLAFAAYIFYACSITASRLERSETDHSSTVNFLTAVQEERDALQSKVEELQLALDDTSTQLADTTAERDAFKTEAEALREKVPALEQEIAFYDAYVVFVMPEDTDKLYHNYACDHFRPQGFVAYSVKMAQSHGYSPCPDCCG